ncbi:UNVERIFIED_CONTAM: Rhodanese-like domain-containing protein 6, partial [Sesamum latifolium]
RDLEGSKKLRGIIPHIARILKMGHEATLIVSGMCKLFTRRKCEEKSAGSHKKTILPDARNLYETRIGKYDAPDVKTLDQTVQYSDLPSSWMDNNTGQLRGNNILTPSWLIKLLFCSLNVVICKLISILVQHFKTLIPGLKTRISAALVSGAKEHASYGENTESKAAASMSFFFSLMSVCDVKDQSSVADTSDAWHESPKSEIAEHDNTVFLSFDWENEGPYEKAVDSMLVSICSVLCLGMADLRRLACLFFPVNSVPNPPQPSSLGVVASSSSPQRRDPLATDYGTIDDLCDLCIAYGAMPVLEEVISSMIATTQDQLVNQHTTAAAARICLYCETHKHFNYLYKFQVCALAYSILPLF